jgi:DHA1 family bicyclomycin/chloramphenicol resistance-like MFS transporter
VQLNRSNKEIGRVEFIVMIACIMLLTALAIDMMLPAFGELRAYFNLPAESTATAQIVTFFFIGQVGQLAFGPLADRYGRLFVLRIGFVFYIGGCLAAALSPSLTFIYIARFFVGMGAAGLSVAAFTSVRDRFSGDEMARTMALMLTIFLFTPVIAPVLGSALLTVASWQVVFATPALFAVVVFIWSFLRLRESLTPERRLALDVPTIVRSARLVLGNRTFVIYTVVTTLIFSAFISYVGSSERIVSEIFGRPDLFVLIFSATGLTMALFTFMNAKLIRRIGAKRAVRGLLFIYLAMTTLLLILTLVFGAQLSIFVFFVIVALLQGLYIAIEPSSGALALEPLGETAGMAAAIYGTTFLVLGSMLGSLIDRQLVDSVTPLAVGYFISALIAVVVLNVSRPKTAPEAAPVPAGD